MSLLRRISNALSSTYTDRGGYKRRKSDSKPIHRIVAEKMTGGPLKKGAVVHHKNRNKQDNSRKNLFVFSDQKAHDKAHKIDARKFGKKASYKGFK
jgi:hypothetical protein